MRTVERANEPDPLSFIRRTLSVAHTLLTALPLLCLVTFAALAGQAGLILGHWPDLRRDGNAWRIPGLSLTPVADHLLVWTWLSLLPWAFLTIVLLVGWPRDRWLWLRLGVFLLSWLMIGADPTGLFDWTWD